MLNFLAKPFLLFKYVIFRYFWLSVFFCLLGFWMHRIGAAWLMSRLTHSPLMVSLVESFLFLPSLFLSVFAGHLSDKYDRKAYLAIVISTMILFSLVLAFFTKVHWITPLWLLIFTLLLGSGSAMRNSALSSELSILVPIEDRKKAVALDNMSFDMARILGPALGGFLITYSGPSLLFLLNGVLSIGAVILFITRYKKRNMDHLQRSENVNDFSDRRWQGLLKNKIYIKLLIKAALFFSCSNVIWSFLPLLVMQRFHSNAHEYGFLFSCFGIGSIVGGL